MFVSKKKYDEMLANYNFKHANDLEKINQMINSFKMIKKEIKNCMVTKKENLEAIEILKKLRKESVRRKRYSFFK